MIESMLIVVWLDNQSICIWGAEGGESFQRVGRYTSEVRVIRISGDGSKVFCLTERSIQAWSIQTGEVVGKVEFEGNPGVDPLYVDDSKVWVCFEDLSIQGWDFGILGTSPILLSNTFPDWPHLKLVGGTDWETGPTMIKDIVTGKEVFQLAGRYAKPLDVQWDGQYLAVGYESGEILILAFDDALLQ